MSWTDAQRYCREQFHDLATIDNLEDLERRQASRRGSDYDIDIAWIGLYDDRTRWQWSHGNQDYKMGQDYDNWAGDEPNNVDAKQNCTVIMPQTGEWSDRRCSDLACPVCINAAGNYIYVQEKMTWYKARKYCVSHHTELAIVRDATENSKIYALMNSNAWIGLHRNPWSHWSDGSRTTYLNWETGQPINYGGNQNCASMNFITADYRDKNCQDFFYVACQELQIQRSTFRIKISTEADMTNPEVQRQFVEQLSAKMAKEGVTGMQIHWIVKDGQDQQSKK
uniref:C-type lectin domain-containing protein n=1 Tax=Gadus morhua TaxID=8049 RepID=A0A8C5A205_GADMO